ncbi:MAG: DUF2059 domain-containing protein [Psychroflexus salarius]
MKKLVLLVMLCVASFGFAQDVDSAHMKDAVRMMKMSNNTVETALEPLYMQIPEDKIADFKKDLQPVLDNMYEKLAKKATEVYSHEEIKAMLEFYNTDLGKKMLEGQDEIFQASMQIGQEMSMEMMPIFQKYMQN